MKKSLWQKSNHVAVAVHLKKGGNFLPRKLDRQNGFAASEKKKTGRKRNESKRVLKGLLIVIF